MSTASLMVSSCFTLFVSIFFDTVHWKEKASAARKFRTSPFSRFLLSYSASDKTFFSRCPYGAREVEASQITFIRKNIIRYWGKSHTIDARLTSIQDRFRVRSIVGLIDGKFFMAVKSFRCGCRHLSLNKSGSGGGRSALLSIDSCGVATLLERSNRSMTPFLWREMGQLR